MRVIVATNNRGKIAELRALLPDTMDLITLTETGLPGAEETGRTFVENALIKARAASQHAAAAIADDSGLEVDALTGHPGVRSARFAGEAATDEDNNRKLLQMLSDRARAERRARFVSAVAFVTRDGVEYVATGCVEGVITDQSRGTGGFGYDPLFELQDPHAGVLNGRTMAELTVEEKNRVSHRARAYRALVAQLHRAGVITDGGPSGQGLEGIRR